MNALLSCNTLDIAVDECVLVEQLSLELHAGQILVVLGRNGTGKSLTLRTLAGLRSHRGGNITLLGQDMAIHAPHKLSRRDIARVLGYVAQESEEPFPVTALECAVSGRHPHLDFWQWETADDYACAEAALAAVDLSPFAQRSVATLSGGERRRLAIATAFTQNPQVYLLDEPTNHLDPQHQLQVLKQLRARADAGCAVMLSLHDPNLALRFADRALLLFGDGRWRCGDRDILTPEALGELYRVPMSRIEHPQGPFLLPL